MNIQLHFLARKIARPGASALTALSSGVAAANLPRSFRLASFGENPSTQGPIRLDPRLAQTFMATQRERGFERVAIDYNHCTIPGSPDYVQGQPPAIFGYGTPRIQPGIGLVLDNIVWTPLGIEKAADYEDLSPSVQLDAQGNITFVHSVALTTNGCLTDSQVKSLILNSAANPARFEPNHRPTMTKTFSILPPRLDVDSGLKGSDRAAAAFNREHAARVGRERMIQLSAKAPAGQNLTGRERVIAAQDRENAARQTTARADHQRNVLLSAAAPRPGQPIANVDDLPDSLTVMQWGENNSLIVNAETLAKLPGYQSLFKLAQVPILMNSADSATQDDVVAYGTPVVIDGTGIVLQDIQWLPEKAEDVLQFNSISPRAWHGPDSNVVLLLLSVSLMRTTGSAPYSTPVPEFLNLSATEAAARLGIAPPVLRGAARTEAAFKRENAARGGRL